jgi:dimeric dUTPase (all-alpha-NTP-PPase superfamily)
MNLSKLFEMQRQLDLRIEQQHPRQEGEDRLAKKILALQVELGELANCWRGFKYWSHDQEPRTTAKCEMCDGLGNDIYFTGSYDNGTLQECSEPCEYCDGTGDDDSKNPLLEEYVDCLHFLLSIGLEDYIYYDSKKPIVKWNLNTTSIKFPNITTQFNKVFHEIALLEDSLTDQAFLTVSEVEDSYEFLFKLFLGLGEMLGFNWEQVEQAYIEKNKVNHERQDSGY